MYKQVTSYVTYMITLMVMTLLFNIETLTTAGDPCPEKKLLAPCKCSHVSLSMLSAEKQNNLIATTPLPALLRPRAVDKVVNNQSNNSTYYTVVTCKLPKSLSALEDAISNGLHRRSVDKLVVSNLPAKKEHTLVNLPSGWLKNLRIKKFEITDTYLAGDFIFKGNPFEGQAHSLIWFKANNCYLSGGLTYDTAGMVHTKGLNYLPRIEGIDFSRNLLTHVLTMSFRYPPANLTTVNLSYNSISFIETNAFSYIPKLQHLDLSHNLLETITRSIFSGSARSLENLNLSWNQLTALPTDFFNGMPVLRVVNLRSNFLYSLPEKPWLAVWRQLAFVDVTGNFVECNCDLLWLLNILSPPIANTTVTPTPKPLPGQTILGSCAYTVPPKYTESFPLTKLTRSSLNCNYK